MLIESSANQRFMLTLNLGLFPRKALDFQESQDFFQQIIFVDYQLQLLVQHELNGKLLAKLLKNPDDQTAVSEKLRQLIDYVQSIDANYSSSNKTYEEFLYFTVVLAHLHYLDLDLERMHNVLASISIVPTHVVDSIVEADFIEYLNARYYALLGLSNVGDSHAHWIEYLGSLAKYGLKSQIAANRWNDSIFHNILLFLSSSGARPVLFKDLLNQRFGENACAVVAICNFAMKPEHEKYILKDFRSDYIVFLTELINNKIKQQSQFPDATRESYEENDFIESLYETLNDISTHRPVVTFFLKPKLSKTLLVNMTEKTYQSTIVLGNLIRTLIDLEEYDEALAAFKTYVDYLNKEQEQHGGQIRNILEVIDLYSTCIYHFNPLRSLALVDGAASKKFRYNSAYTIMEQVASFTADLQRYLQELTRVAELSYDEELETFADNKLLFLYHRYNTNVLMNDRSRFVRIISSAWFALGNYYSYLATHESPNAESMRENTEKVQLFYKNSLIINSTGSSAYLFNYALVLAHSQALKPAVTLCKFILKRFPESFRTWNLLVLVVSAIETETSGLSDAKHDNSAILDGLNGSASSDLEKFIEDSLNIAGIFMLKNRQHGVSLPLQTKYEILQLKMTHLAVLEARHGVEYILESIAEVFVLYRELFHEIDLPKDPRAMYHHPGSRLDGKWSHRPSVIDPSDTATLNGKSSMQREREGNSAKEKMKRLSKVPSSVVIKSSKPTKAASSSTQREERRILQDVWLWTASIYLKLGLLDEAEQCIVEAETVDKPNVMSYTYLGLLTSKSRKFLSLQEFERSLEFLHQPEEKYSKKAYGLTLLGMCKLFIVDDEPNNSLFISSKDLDAGLIRLKNYLEEYSHCWPYGQNSSEVWYFLSSIYEKFDDKLLFNQSLWRSVELENVRPVRAYLVCEEFSC